MLRNALLVCVLSLVLGQADATLIRFTQEEVAQLEQIDRGWFDWDDDSSSTAFDLDHIFSLEDSLNCQVLGQEEAVSEVVQPVLRYAAGLNAPERPIAVLLFIGPTGVGKTQMAKSLCQELFGVQSQLIRFDMAEYYDDHLISQLIGAPPGYIGFDQGGQLTEAIRGRTNSIILLDEMEKAHTRVRKFFLGLFDEGRVTSGQGRTYDCTNAIFLMTTNIESETVLKLSNQGYSSAEILDQIESKLIKALSPELYNRITPIVFHALTPEAMNQIIVKELGTVSNRVYDVKRIDIRFEDSVRDYLAEQLNSNNLGARPLQRLIDKEIVAPLAYIILQNGLQSGDSIDVRYEDGMLEFEVYSLAL